MKKRIYLIICLAAMFLLCVCAPIYAAAQEPVVITAGRYSVSISQAQKEVDDLIAAYRDTYGGTTFTADDYIYIRDQALSALAAYCVMDNVAEDLALDVFTEEELAELMLQAEDAYQKTLEYFADDYASMYLNLMDEATAVKMAEDYLEKSGCNVESLYQTAVNYAKYDKLFEAVTRDVIMTDDEAQAYYLQNYAEPDRSRFENNVSEYEIYTAAYQQEAFFIPQGYRAVSHILLTIPQDEQAALAICKEKIASVQKTLDEYLALENTPDVIDGKAYAQAELELLNSEYESIRAGILLTFENTLDKIYERISAGESFESLISAYGQDADMLNYPDGCMVHADSTVYEIQYRDAAVSLEKPGDVGDPVLTDSGVYIIKYLSDVPGGTVELNEEAFCAMAEEALGKKKAEAFQLCVDEWSKQYPSTIHPELISLP